MTPRDVSSFVVTVAPILLAPGTSTLLVSSEALRAGGSRVAGIVAGDLTANAGQMAAVGGLLAAMSPLARAIPLGFLRWVGVAYLLVLAGRRLLASPGGPGSGGGNGAAPKRRGFLRGFLVSATNPKALVFFAGLFPAFLRPAEPIVPQLLVLGAVYLALDGCCLSAYALAASRLRRWSRGGSWLRLDRLAGAMLLVAALLLATR